MRAFARRGALVGACIVAVAADGVHAQTEQPQAVAGGRGLFITPSLGLGETLSNNIRLSTDRQADLVTSITPGIRIDSTGGRVKGFFDYSLTGQIYARNPSDNELQNSLNSVVNVEAIEKWAFVDASAYISQQSISAYGTRSADSTSINANRTEVRSFTVSPYLKGHSAGFADYEVRLTQNWTRNTESEAGNNSSSLASLRLDGDTGLRVVSWSANASHQVYDYTIGRRSVDDIVQGNLHFTVNPELSLTLIGGYESTNILSVDKQGQSTPGFGVDWSPSETTHFSGRVERRFFGNSHEISFEHRTPRTVWKYTDSQTVTTGYAQPSAGTAGTVFDLLFTQFASLAPDPVQRAALVNAFLQANGIAATTQVPLGSLSNAVTRQRSQQLSFALLGVRDTIFLGASQTQGLRLDNVSTAVDDFANGNLVRTKAVSIGVTHRLTPLSALNLLVSVDRTTGTVNAPTTSLRSVTLFWTGPVTSRSDYSLGARYSKFSSPIVPYEEAALTGAVNLRF
jgi:uncharacterized protein (PEP-CTERM system associated)